MFSRAWIFKFHHVIFIISLSWYWKQKITTISNNKQTRLRWYSKDVVVSGWFSCWERLKKARTQSHIYFVVRGGKIRLNSQLTMHLNIHPLSSSHKGTTGFVPSITIVLIFHCSGLLSSVISANVVPFILLI